MTSRHVVGLVSRGLRSVHACILLMRTDFAVPHQKMIGCEVHHHTYTEKHNRQEITAFCFAPLGLYLYYLLSFSFLFLPRLQLILTSAVRPDVPALSSSSFSSFSSTLSSSSPRFPSMQVSLSMSGHVTCLHLKS